MLPVVIGSVSLAALVGVARPGSSQALLIAALAVGIMLTLSSVILSFRNILALGSAALLGVVFSVMPGTRVWPVWARVLAVLTIMAVVTLLLISPTYLGLDPERR